MALGQRSLLKVSTTNIWQESPESDTGNTRTASKFLPQPQHRYRTNDTEHEIGEIALSKQFNIQQVADESSDITADDTDKKVHATSFALTAHKAVGNVANENAREYRPCRKICNVIKHNLLWFGCESGITVKISTAK